MEYRAISLHQPWASLVALGIKKYETRSWETKYRGKLLICSAKRHSVNVGILKDLGLIWSEYPFLYPEDITDATESQKQLVRRLGWTWRENISRYEASVFDYIKSSPYFDIGKVLCVVDLVGCLKMGTNVFRKGKDSFYLDSRLTEISNLEQLCGDWRVGRYAWELANLMPLPNPIPIKGKQGLWIPDSSIITEVEKQLSIG